MNTPNKLTINTPSVIKFDYDGGTAACQIEDIVHMDYSKRTNTMEMVFGYGTYSYVVDNSEIFEDIFTKWKKFKEEVKQIILANSEY